MKTFETVIVDSPPQVEMDAGLAVIWPAIEPQLNDTVTVLAPPTEDVAVTTAVPVEFGAINVVEAMPPDTVAVISDNVPAVVWNVTNAPVRPDTTIVELPPQLVI